MHSAREDKEHPISIPLMNPPANAFQPCIIRVMTRPLVKLPTVCYFISFFFLFFHREQQRGEIFVFLLPAHWSTSPSVIPFLSSLPLRSCIVVSSSWAVGASRVSYKHYRQAHFSQVDFPAILQDVSRKYVTDSHHTSVLALERRCSVASGHGLSACLLHRSCVCVSECVNVFPVCAQWASTFLCTLTCLTKLLLSWTDMQMEPFW